MTKHEAVFTKDQQNKQITVVRPFAASQERVWQAWTDSRLLDLWWAPKPFKAATMDMDFRSGGHWFYYMQGPEGERHYCRFNYRDIATGDFYTGSDMFTDENGKRAGDFPSMDWTVNFIGEGNLTTVTVLISFEKEEDMDTILKMGFEEGFKMGLGNLDEVLEKQ